MCLVPSRSRRTWPCCAAGCSAQTLGHRLCGLARRPGRVQAGLLRHLSVPAQGYYGICARILLARGQQHHRPNSMHWWGTQQAMCELHSRPPHTYQARSPALRCRVLHSAGRAALARARQLAAPTAAADTSAQAQPAQRQVTHRPSCTGRGRGREGKRMVGVLLVGIADFKLKFQKTSPEPIPSSSKNSLHTVWQSVQQQPHCVQAAVWHRG